MIQPIFDGTLPRYATCKNVTRTPMGGYPFCSQSRFIGDFPCEDCEAYEPYPFPIGSHVYTCEVDELTREGLLYTWPLERYVARFTFDRYIVDEIRYEKLFAHMYPSCECRRSDYFEHEIKNPGKSILDALKNAGEDGPAVPTIARIAEQEFSKANPYQQGIRLHVYAKRDKIYGLKFGLTFNVKTGEVK